jgi:ankyrin repeat protein
MNRQPPVRAMREHPDLDQLKRQARELLAACRAQQPEALQEFSFHLPLLDARSAALHDAQFVLARSYGFQSWPKLKAAVDGVTAARLHAAVESGDVDTARALLQRRPEIVDLGRGELRALHMAVLRNDVPMVRLLLERGADPHSGIWPNRDATSAYRLAQERGYDEIVGLITAALAGRGMRGPQQAGEDTAKLEAAFRSGSEDAVIAVFEQYPHLAQMCPADGTTMLHQMASRRSLRIIKWLLDHGADVNARSRLQFAMWDATMAHSKAGFTPIEFAALGDSEQTFFDARSYEATAQLLLDHGAELGPLSAATLGRWDWLSQRSRQELEGIGVLEAAVKGNQIGTLRHLLDLGLDPDERMPVGPLEEQNWTAAGPLFQAVILQRIDMAKVLLERGADPNAGVWTAGSPAYRAYEGSNSQMLELIQNHGGWIDAGSAGYARRVEIARRMLAGEIDGHVTPNDFSGHTVEEQLLWGGGSSCCAEIVRMALEHIHWRPEDPRWFWMLWRPVPGHEDLDPQQQADCIATFRLILDRSGPNHRAQEHGQTMLHEVIARDHNVGVALATMLLDAGARTDVRDRLLESTPLGWACRWGRTEIVKLLLSRGADPVEADAPAWATPMAWAQKRGHAGIVQLLAQALPVPRPSP